MTWKKSSLTNMEKTEQTEQIHTSHDTTLETIMAKNKPLTRETKRVNVLCLIDIYNISKLNGTDILRKQVHLTYKSKVHPL